VNGLDVEPFISETLCLTAGARKGKASEYSLDYWSGREDLNLRPLGPEPNPNVRIAGAEVVIERNAEAVAVLRPAAPNVRLLSESLRLEKERGSNSTLDGEFGRDLEAVVTSHREPLTPPAWD
jgi:hypothetical protein